MDASDPLHGLSEEIRAHLAKVRLVVFDVDGTLTDGHVQARALDRPRFDVHDGQGLAWLRKVAGLQVAWISGRAAAATLERGRELGVQHLRMGVGPKGPVMEALQRHTGFGREQTLAMGDDLPDLALAARAGVFAAPANARPEVRAAAQWETRSAGGRGAAREVCEGLLAAQGHWSGILEAVRG